MASGRAVVTEQPRRPPPLCSRITGLLSFPLALSERANIILAALLVNLFAFGLAAEALRSLSTLVLRRADLAWLAVCWFCVTPAGIFMSAAYTER